MLNAPLFNQSSVYSIKIDKAVETFRFNRYFHKIYVNLIYKYDSRYYADEEGKFIDGSEKYLSDLSEVSLDREFLNFRVARRFFFRQVLKVFVHYVFRVFEVLGWRLMKSPGISVLRKCYVEDTESLFDMMPGVVRVIYPFPLNFKRQIKYLIWLSRNKNKYLLSGLHYSFSDVWLFFFYRDYRSFLRMESRAQMRSAYKHLKFENIKTIQCSDEYDIGSMYYSRIAMRGGRFVHNSAHGIGKYLPYQKYSRFDILTFEQRDFYSRFNSGKYVIRKIGIYKKCNVYHSNKPAVCLLGQYSKNAPRMLLEQEKKALKIMSKVSLSRKEVDFLYKKHPNCNDTLIGCYEGVKVVGDEVIGADIFSPIYFSFYSTCQIDPNFVGEKFLLKSDFIIPEIAYGNYEPIVELSEFEEFLEEVFLKE